MAFSRRSAALVAMAVLMPMTALVARERVVSAVPQSNALYAAIGMPVNLDRLVIGPVQATLRVENDLRTLLVESEIANPRTAPYALPPLRLSIRDSGGATLYTWTTTPPAKSVPPGGRVPVRARLTAPPPGQDVVIEFVRSPA